MSGKMSEIRSVDSPLPKGWRWVRLGEMCQIIRGASPRPKGDPRYFGGTIPWIKISDVTKSAGMYLETSEEFLTEDGKSKSVFLKRGTLIVTNSATIGLPKILNIDGCIHDGFLAFVDLSPLLERDYLYWHFSEIRRNLESIAPQGTQKNLNTAIAKDLLIPLPPPVEQRHIAGRIQELMHEVERARAACEKQLESAKAIPPAYLREVFENEEAKKWERKRMGEIFDVKQGVAMSPKRRQGNSPHHFLRTLNVLWGHVDLSMLDEMDFTDEEVARLSLKPGDLLVCEGGEVGRTAVWRGELDVCLHQNHIHRLRRLSDSVVPGFYMYWMQAAFQVFGSYTGQESRTTIPNLSGSRLKSFVVPVPPITVQERIASELKEKISLADKLRTPLEKQLAAINALPQAILRKAFTGTL